MKKVGASPHAWTAFGLACVALAFAGCASTGPAVPSGPDSTLLVIPAESKVRLLQENMRRAPNPVFVTGAVGLRDLSYAVAVQGTGVQISVNPEEGNSYVTGLKPGRYRLGALVQFCTPTLGAASQYVKERSLDFEFELRPRQVTVLPYKFVFVLVNEDAESGMGTIALKVRNLTRQERERIETDVEGKGPPNALEPRPPRVAIKAWDRIDLAGAPETARIYPVESAGITRPVVSVSPEYPPPPVRVAVLALRPQGVAAGDASTLTDLLGSALARAPWFSVLEHARVERAVKESQPGSDAADQGLQVQAAKGLGADYVVVGTVSRLGARYVMDAKLIDAVSGETKRSSSAAQNNIEELVASVGRMAAELSSP